MFEVLLKDKGVLSKFKWNYLMVDEAHRLNNSKAAVYVSHVEFRTKIKLLITGTPLQNNVEELRIRSDADEDFNVFGAKDVFSKLQGLSINHSATMLGRYWHFEKDLGLFIQYRIGLDDEHIVKGILHNVLGDYKVKSRSIGVAEVKAFALVLLQGCLMCLGKIRSDVDEDFNVFGARDVFCKLYGLDDEHIVKEILHSVLGDDKVKSRSIGVAEVKDFALVLLQGCLMCLGKIRSDVDEDFNVFGARDVFSKLYGLDDEHIVKEILHSVLGDNKVKSRFIGVAEVKAFALVLLQELEAMLTKTLTYMVQETFSVNYTVWLYSHVATMFGRIRSDVDEDFNVFGARDVFSKLYGYKVKSRSIGVAEVKDFALVLLQGCLMYLGKIRSDVDEDFNVFGARDVFSKLYGLDDEHIVKEILHSVLGDDKVKSRSIGVAEVKYRIGLDDEHIVKEILHSVLGDDKVKSRSIGVAEIKVWLYSHVATMFGRIGLDDEHIVKEILHSVLGDDKVKSRSIGVAEVKAFALVLLQELEAMLTKTLTYMVQETFSVNYTVWLYSHVATMFGRIRSDVDEDFNVFGARDVWLYNHVATMLGRIRSDVDEDFNVFGARDVFSKLYGYKVKSRSIGVAEVKDFAVVLLQGCLMYLEKIRSDVDEDFNVFGARDVFSKLYGYKVKSRSIGVAEVKDFALVLLQGCLMCLGKIRSDVDEDFNVFGARDVFSKLYGYKVKSRSIGVAEVKDFAVVLLQGCLMYLEKIRSDVDEDFNVFGARDVFSKLYGYKVKSRSTGVAEVKDFALVLLQGCLMCLGKIRSDVDEDFNVFGARDVFSKLYGYKVKSRSIGVAEVKDFALVLLQGCLMCLGKIRSDVDKDFNVFGARDVFSKLYGYKVKSRSIGVAEVKAFALVLLQGCLMCLGNIRSDVDEDFNVFGARDVFSKLYGYKVKSRSIGVAEVKDFAVVLLQGCLMYLEKIRSDVDEDFNVFGARDVFSKLYVLEVMLTKTLTYLVQETFSVNYTVWLYNHVATMLGRYWRLEKDLGYKVKSRSIGVAEVKDFAVVLLQGCLMYLEKIRSDVDEDFNVFGARDVFSKLYGFCSSPSTRLFDVLGKVRSNVAHAS
ncbi:hypothetical protein AgCh_022770 [Apium graveolens]